MSVPTSFARHLSPESLQTVSGVLIRPTLLLLVVLTSLQTVPIGWGQRPNRIAQEVDTSRAQALPNHHPQWANPGNDAGLLAPNQLLDNMTMVLARSAEQEQAFKQLLADQQNPSSPDYHHWLTPEEIGTRFGLADQDIATINGWLQTQGLHVNWVAPSRTFVGFGGTAADVGRAFQTEMHTYKVNGKQRISASSDPTIPQALVPVIKTIRGLYTIEEKPLHHLASPQQPTPAWTDVAGSYYYVTPADFATIYDLPASLTGAGVTIGIVGRSRTNPADYNNFKTLTGSTFANPTEIIPTAFGGVDPGPAYTSPQGPSVYIDDQGEAELDVLRAGSVAPGAQLLLVVASQNSGGITADAQYLIQTSPVPAQVISFSYSGCESGWGSSGVAFWDTLFQQAAGEGISVFVVSGDEGASGCDAIFSPPPSNPAPNSINHLCSSSYVTCVGGTEFNDAGNYSLYWNSSNTGSLGSALSYIPEGAFNESWNGTTAIVTASGGGVSAYIPTPSWQTGTGVPSDRAGRYVPDVSFTASGHDGYFGCFTAGGWNCATPQNFEVIEGVSAAAPSMAGIAALLDQKLGAAQGNLNPRLYQMAASVPSAFHDVTVATSGVTSCSVNIPSMCNNSIPGPTGLVGTQPGYLVTTGYDEVTGLGSLDVQTFINNYSASTLVTPTATTGSATAITASSATLGGTVNPNGTDTQVWFLYGTSSTLIGASQTASQDLGSGTTTSAVSANIASLSAGTVYYFQVVAQSSAGTSYGSINTITTTTPPKTTPTMTVVPTPTSITTAQQLSVTVTINATSGNPTPTGTVTVLGGTFSGGGTLVSGSATIVIPAGSFPVGTGQLTATYQGDSNYNTQTATNSVTVTTPPKTTPTMTWATPGPITYGTPLSATQLDATASVAGTFSYSPAMGTILTAGIQALTVSFTPADTTDYNTASGSVMLTVIKATPTITWPTPASVTAGTALSATQLNATTSVPGTFVYNPAMGTVVSSPGSITLSATFTPTDITDYNNASTTVLLIVIAAVNPSFTIAGDAGITVPAGATTGNTSTVTVTPANGFTGTISLSCTITPTAASNPATCNLPAAVTINGTTAQTATLTVNTTKAIALNTPLNLFGLATGGAALACILLFGIPARRRRLSSMLGMFALLMVLAGSAIACSGKASSVGGTTGTPGTTPGTYTVTLTGASGSMVQTATVALTVQ